MKYYVLLSDGTLSPWCKTKSLAETIAIAAEHLSFSKPVAIVNVMPREELIEHEMEAQLRSVFNDIPGVSFSHQ